MTLIKIEITSSMEDDFINSDNNFVEALNSLSAYSLHVNNNNALTDTPSENKDETLVQPSSNDPHLDQKNSLKHNQ